MVIPQEEFEKLGFEMWKGSLGTVAADSLYFIDIKWLDIFWTDIILRL